MQQNQAYFVLWRHETIFCNDRATIIMVGRKRSRKYREPSGRVQRDPAVSRINIAKLFPHRRGLSDKDVIDPKAETQFGGFGHLSGALRRP